MSKYNLLVSVTLILLGTYSIYANPDIKAKNKQSVQTVPNVMPKQNNNVSINTNQVNNNINQQVNNNSTTQQRNNKLVLYNNRMNDANFVNRLKQRYNYNANEQILKNTNKLPPNPIPYKERTDKEMKELQQSILTNNINAIKRNSPTEYKQFVNHLTDVGASYSANFSNSSEVAMANQKILAQQNKIQVSPETKELQLTAQQIQNLISNIRSKLNEMAIANDKRTYHKSYQQLCKIFYNLWMLQVNKDTQIATYMDIWKQDNINYQMLTDIWKTACTKEYYNSIIKKLSILFDAVNIRKYKIKLQDIRMLVNDYRLIKSQLNYQTEDSQKINTIINTGKLSNFSVENQDVNKYLGTSINNDELTKKQIQEHKNMQRIIAHQAQEVRGNLKTVGQLKINNKQFVNNNFEKKNNIAPVVKQQMVREKVIDKNKQVEYQNQIYLLLQGLENSSNINEFDSKYLALCNYCYNIWIKYRTFKQQYNYSNLDDIWNINSVNYQLIQKMLSEAFSNHANNIFNKLSTLYNGDKYINYKVNKRIDKLQDVRYLIQDYILHKTKRNININTKKYR